MRVHGYLRFSFLGKNDTKFYRQFLESTEAYAAAMFATDRLEQRFYLFENFCLPSFRHQTDPDFTLTLLVSESMPDAYMARLKALISDVPQCNILTAPIKPVEQALQDTIYAQVTEDDENTLHFRVDDDDPLPQHFIETIKRHGTRAEPNTIICLPRGMTLFSHEGTGFLAPNFAILHARGWARVNATGDVRTPYRFGHGSAGQRFVSVMDPRPLGYIATHHDTSDTIRRGTGRLPKWLKDSASFESAPTFRRLKREIHQAYPWIGYEGLKEKIKGCPEIVREQESA